MGIIQKTTKKPNIPFLNNQYFMESIQPVELFRGRSTFAAHVKVGGSKTSGLAGGKGGSGATPFRK